MTPLATWAMIIFLAPVIIAAALLLDRWLDRVIEWMDRQEVPRRWL